MAAKILHTVHTVYHVRHDAYFADSILLLGGARYESNYLHWGPIIAEP